MDGAADPWFDRELAGCTLADERLVTRLRKLLVQMGSAMEQKSPGLPRLGQYQGSLPLLLECAGQRSGHSSRPFSIDP